MGRDALSQLVSAGRQALAAADWEAARAHFEEALAVEQSAEVLAGLGEALQWEGEYDRAIELRERAFSAYRDRAMPREASEQARSLAFLHAGVHSNWSVANGWFGRAERVLEGVEQGVHHGWLAFERAPLSDDPAERERLAMSALAIARRFGDADLEFDSLALLGEAYVYSGRIDQGMELIDEAMTAVSSGEVKGIVAVGDIYCRLLSACERTTDVRRAEEWMSVADDFAAQTRSPLVSTTCRLHYGGILVATGRWAEAEEELLAAIRISETSYRMMRRFPLVRLADLRVRQGRLEEAQQLLEGSEWHPAARRSLAAIALARGELGLARDLARLCLEAEDMADPGCAPLLALVAQVHLADGDLPAADEALGRLSRLASESADLRARAYADLVGGGALAAKRDPEASVRLQAALEGFSVLELPLEAARARLELARALGAGSNDGAVAEARLALDAFERLGAARDADAAAALLRELGAPERVWPRQYGPLTKRETTVLSLLADGLSNGEIGERLYISRRTAEHHVASILSKLGLHSRAEAAAYAVRNPPERPVAG